MGKSFDLGSFAQTLQVAHSDNELQTGPRTIEAVTMEILSLKKTAGDAIIGIGQCLIEAKDMLSHGEWLPWLTEKVDFSERTATRFMRLAREWTNRTTLSDLGASKALQLLALPPDERESFLEAHHIVNGEEKTVIDMSARELEKALRERDEAKAAKEHAEESRAKMEADMVALKQLQAAALVDADASAADLAKAREELQALRAQPVDVAVMSVDQEALAKARADAVAQMQEKVDKALEAKTKAEEKRKTAEASLDAAKAAAVAELQAKMNKTEAALQAARQQLEDAARREKQTALTGDKDLATFEVIFGQAQEDANKLRGLLLKVRGRGDADAAERLKKALLALADAVRGCAE